MILQKQRNRVRFKNNIIHYLYYGMYFLALLLIGLNLLVDYLTNKHENGIDYK